MSLRIENTRALKRLVKRIDEVDKGFLRDLSKALADETVELVELGFDKERGPYGNKWRRKKRPDGRPVLVGKTARLRRWHRAFASSRAFGVATTVEYFRHHQFGAPRAGIPVRRMVPTRSRGLPRAWGRAYDAVIRLMLRRRGWKIR